MNRTLGLAAAVGAAPTLAAARVTNAFARREGAMLVLRGADPGF